MKALFITASPLQLLNAVEAKAYYKIADENANVVLLKGISNKSFWQQVELVNYAKWSNVSFLNYRFRSLYVFKLMNKIGEVVRLNSDVDVVFMGEYRNPLMRHIANKIQPKQIVLLDDGNATIHLASDRKSSIKHHGVFERLKYDIIYKLAKINDQYIKRVTFYTIYNINPVPPDEVIKNTYAQLKTKLLHKPQSREIFFLGCPFVETDTVSRNFSEHVYLTLLEKVQKDLNSKYDVSEIVYVAHRRERKEKLKKVSKITGFSVIDFNEPIEIAIIKNARTPKAFATFFSAAVDTLVTMFGSDIKLISYRIPESCIDKDKQTIVDGYYDYYGEVYCDRIRMVNL